MAVIAIISDLIFSTKVSSTAKDLGISVKFARSLDSLDQKLAEFRSATLIVDLEAETLDPVSAIARARASADRSLRIIAYASHVKADLIQAARHAGADEVMARSAFVSRLPSILNASAIDDAT